LFVLWIKKKKGGRGAPPPPAFLPDTKEIIDTGPII